MSAEKEYTFVQPPKNTPYVFPQPPSHNPDPTYRPMLLKVLNESAEEGGKIQACLASPRLAQLEKLREFATINKEAKDLLIKDGYKGLLGGKRRRTKTQKRRKGRRNPSRRHKKN